jgi:hypothetical protein
MALVVLAAAVAATLGCGNGSSHAGPGGGGNGATAGSGAGGATGGGGRTGTGGSNGGCSIYQAVCGGACVTVASDPKNCGSCGHQCSASTPICVGGGCTGSCLPGAGQTACAGTCVDLQTDNGNCGTCGHACGMNQGCVGGNCAAAKVFPPPASCTGGGPAVTVGGGSAAKCAGLVAQTNFTWGVCSCKNVSFSSEALVDAWDSTKGPYVAGQLGGGVGADMSISTDGAANIYGQSWAASTATAFDTQQLTVHQDLQSGGTVAGGDISVTRDAYVAGDITSDSMTVGRNFYQPSGKGHPSNLTPMNQAVTVPPPCNCGNLIPVGDLVTWAKTNNDDAAIGLDPGIMSMAGHPARVDLPCGVYYMTGFSGGGEIVAHGNVALLIDGSVTSSADLVLTVADASSAFDIFVSGTIVATSSFKLGSPSYPALTRLYVGGTQTLDVQSTLIVGGEIWAGNATVLWESDSAAFGSIFAGDFQVVSNFTLHYDQGVVRAGDSCPPPGGGGAGGAGGGSCGTCHDCGNQACVNGTCGQCASNADCCPPLSCTAGHCGILID